MADAAPYSGALETGNTHTHMHIMQGGVEMVGVYVATVHLSFVI